MLGQSIALPTVLLNILEWMVNFFYSLPCFTTSNGSAVSVAEQKDKDGEELLWKLICSCQVYLIDFADQYLSLSECNFLLLAVFVVFTIGV